MRAMDLFCGAGGASHGLHLAGFDVHGYDHWQPAVDTHNANGLPATLADLSTFDPPGTCDLLWASPPCQPFSAAGNGDGEFDGRDGFPWLLRILERMDPRPPVVIVENVKGLTFAKHSDYFGGVLAAIRGLGYDVDWRVLNCADYGVPQTRERCLIVARRDGGPITWPMPTHTEQAGMFTAPWVAMAQALGCDIRGVDYRQTGGDGSPCYCDVTERPSPTISTVACGQWLLDPWRRPLFVEEAAVLQGFPRNWIWTGNKTAQARQVGNAVPPALAYAVASANMPICKAVAA